MKHTSILADNKNFNNLVKVQELLNQATDLFEQVAFRFCLTEDDETGAHERFLDGRAGCETAIQRLLGTVAYAVLFDGVDQYLDESASNAENEVALAEDSDE